MNDVDKYFEQVSGEARLRLEQIRAVIREEVPDGVERISYAMPTCDWGGHHVIHYAGFKNHIGLYPTPHGITAFEAELAPYQTAEGSIQLPLDQALPLDLVRRIVRFRAAAVKTLKPKRA